MASSFMHRFRAETKVCLDPENEASSQQPSSFQIAGVEYVRDSEIMRPEKRKLREKRSAAHQFGEVVVATRSKKKYYYCYCCERQSLRQQLPVWNGTTNALTHLEKHKISKQGLPIDMPRGNTMPKATEHAQLVHIAQGHKFKQLLIRWLVYCHVALSMLENRYFRELIAYLNVSLAALLPYARSTLRKWIFADYEAHKKRVQTHLSSALSRIHFSFDIWTSPNSHSIIAVFGHFIDSSGKKQRRLLAFRRMAGKHTGENIAAMLVEVIQEWGVPGKQIGWFMCDNAQNNDKGIDLALQQLCPCLSPRQRKARRLRCFGHTCNLVARSVLLGKGAGKMLGDLELKTRKGAFEAVDAAWRRFGGLGRLHNIIRYIRASPSRREEFAGVKGRKEWSDFDDLELIADNTTRWTSFFDALKRALNLKDRIERFCKSHKPAGSEKGLRDDFLNRDHWHQINRTHDILTFFNTAILKAEGHKGYLSIWYRLLHWLMNEIQILQEDLSLDQNSDQSFLYLRSNLDHAFHKATKYFKLCDDAPIYFLAILVDPSQKQHFFKMLWKDWNKRNTQDQRYYHDVTRWAKELWEEEYKSEVITNTGTCIRSSIPAKRTYEESVSDRLMAFMNGDSGLTTATATGTIDAFEDYLATDRVPFIPTEQQMFYDPLPWWYERRESMPELAKMAFDCLAIPLMSDDPERSFSSGRDLITYRRNSLKCDLIEALECLRHWYGTPEAVTMKNDRQEDFTILPFDPQDEIEADYFVESNGGGDEQR